MVYGQCRGKFLEFIPRLWMQGAFSVLEIGPVSLSRWSGSEAVKTEIPGAEKSSVFWTHKIVVSPRCTAVSEDGGKLNSEILYTLAAGHLGL